MSAFEELQEAGRWADAWSCLAPLPQSRTGSLEVWASAGELFNAQGGGPFTMEEPTTDWTVLNYNYVGDIEAEVPGPSPTWS